MCNQESFMARPSRLDSRGNISIGLRAGHPSLRDGGKNSLLLQFGQIHFMIWTNTFYNFDKYNL